MKYIDDLKEKIRILYYFFSPSTVMLVAIVILTIIYGLVETAAVGAMFPVLEAGFEGITQQRSNVMGLLSIKGWYLKAGMVLGLNYLVISSLILIIISILSFFYKAFYTYFNQRVMAYLWNYYQKRIYSVLSRAKYVFYTNEKQGKIIYDSAVASDSIAAVIDSLTRGVSAALKALFLMTFLFISSKEVTMIAAIIGIIYILLSKKIIQEMVNKSSMEILSLRQKQHQNLNEFITGIKLIKVFNKSLFWMNQYMKMAERNAKLLIRVQMGSSLPSFFIQMVVGAGIGVIGIYMGIQSNTAIVSLIPLLGLFVIAFSRINDAVSTAINYLAAVARHFPGLCACYEILNKTPVISQNKSSGKKFSFNKEISFKNVSFSYDGSSDNIISDISFVIPKNNTIALVGASGCGKTTILNLLLRLFKNQAGKILIDGTDIHSIDLDDYYQAIGFVSQDPFLFNGTIFENVAFGSQASLEEVRTACEKVDAHEFIEDLNMGYHSVVGDSGIKLSGGQKQRISIARALLKQPQLLILDEPTSALDNESEQRIQKTLDKLSHSLTVLVVAHRLSTVRNADKIVVLKDGRVMEEGRHQDLIALGKHYYQLYR